MSCRETLNITAGTDVILNVTLEHDGIVLNPALINNLQTNLVTGLGKRTPLEVSPSADYLVVNIPWVDGRIPGYYSLEITGSINGLAWSTVGKSIIRYTSATEIGPGTVDVTGDGYDVTMEVGYYYTESPIEGVSATIDDGVGEPSVETSYIHKQLSFDFHNLRGNGITSIETDEQQGDEAVNTVTIKTDLDDEGTDFHVRNGSRGNGITSIEQISTSTEAHGVNVVKIRTTDNQEGVNIEILNGGDGPQGDSVLVGQGDLPLSNVVDDASNKAVTPKAVAEKVLFDGYIRYLRDYSPYTIDENGAITSSQDANNVIKVYLVKPNTRYYVSGFQPSLSSTSVPVVFKKGENGISNPDNYITLGFIRFDDYPSSAFSGLEIVTPEGCNTLYVFGKTNRGDISAVPKPIDVKDVVEEDSVEIKGLVKPTEIYEQKVINKSDGSITDTSGSAVFASCVNKYQVTPNTYYLASGFQPSASGTATSIAFFNGSMFISSLTLSEYSSSTFKDVKVKTPSNCTIMLLQGRETWGELSLKKYPEFLKVTEAIEMEMRTAPMMFNLPPVRKSVDETLKIMCFGSSWFMDTWWYLNHIIASAGINAELHCYYVGGCSFKEWSDMYDNDISSVVARAPRASKNISVNGSDWVITAKGEGGYTYQNLRDDWFADLTAGGWDIIAIQQGAASSADWEDWGENAYNVAKIVKKHGFPSTHIALNSTWAPAKNNTSVLPTTGKAAQLAFQAENWKNTMRFMMRSGLLNASPGGKVMYLLRESSLNTNTDLADDTLHPNNGLPIYALGGAFFDTFIAPMYGVSFASVDWLPTSSTEKAIVSGTSFTAVSINDRNIVRGIIRDALGDRFDF